MYLGCAATIDCSLSPLFRGERVGVRGSLSGRDSWREPLTRRFAPTSPREERGEVGSNRWLNSTLYRDSSPNSSLERVGRCLAGARQQRRVGFGQWLAS